MRKHHIMLVIGGLLIITQIVMLILCFASNNLFNNLLSIIGIITCFTIGVLGVVFLIIGIYIMFKRSNGMSFKLNAAQITDYDFKHIIKPIITNLQDKPYEHLVVDFTNAGDRQDITFIQTVQYDKVYLLEVGKCVDGKNYLYRLENQKISEVLKIFYIVCVLEFSPDFTKWQDVTKEVLSKKSKNN